MNSWYWKSRYSFLISLGLVGLSISAGPLAGQTDGATPAPSAARQEAMLSAMRQYAADYISHLPNFICTQDTQQFEAGRKPKRWHKGDTLRFKLVFNAGTEERSIELVNNQPARPGRRWRAPLTTEGEFGTLLGSVFGERSSTVFNWRGWDSVRGHRVTVFDFAVDQEHSTLKLTLSDLAHSVVPYHGSVYADPETGEVWRITNSPYDIPPEIQTKSISTTIEYGEVPIGGATYLLPVAASVLLDTGTNNIRNEISFGEYRKFEADSRITYASDGEAAEPAKAAHPK